MHLLYLYLDFTKNGERPEGYRGYKQCELNFGARDIYTIERPSGNQAYYLLNRIEREESAQIEPGFWGDERIYNISAMVGENGTGKTTLVHAMTRVLTALYERIPPKLPCDFVCLMQDTDQKSYLICSQPQWEIDIRGFVCEKVPYLFDNTPIAALKNTKLLYFSNNISIADLVQYDSTRSADRASDTGPMYDGSLLASMMGAQNASSLSSNERLLNEQLYTYFEFESYQEVRYLFNRSQREILLHMRRQGYPVPFPRELTLRIRFAAEHLESVLNTSKKQYRMEDMKAWERRYSEFRHQAWNPYLVVFELSLNCAANFLELARRSLGDEALANVILPERFDDPSSYMELLHSVFFPQEHPKLEKAYQACKNYVAFLWNNREHIRKYWRYQRNKGCTIALGDQLDPILQELMIRFVDLNHEVSLGNHFVTYSWGLSSGERILLDIFIKLRCALSRPLFNLTGTEFITEQSLKDAENFRIKEWAHYHFQERKKYVCDSAILFFDEADLSLHPEWQRMFVATLAEYLPRLCQDSYFHGITIGCRDIQIILTTHSPLMLGDFPSASVLYLKKGKDGLVTVENNSTLQPFGQNLYTLLKDGFYLQKGAIGGLAQKKIQDILADIQAVKALSFSAQTDPHDLARELDAWEARLEAHRRKTVRYLPKGILRGKLEEELDLAFAVITQKRGRERMEQKKQELNQEIARLQRQLYELENGGEESQ